MSIDPDDPAGRLRRAQLEVLARLAEPTAGAPAPVRSSTPIRTLPATAAALVAARSRVGLSPVGEFHPRRVQLRRVALPALALALVAAATAVVALGTGHGTLTVSAVCTFAVLALVSAAVGRWALADPLRISSSVRAVIDAASRWSPGRSAVPAGPARVLVAVAATAAQQVVDSAAWRSGILARAGVAVPLATELDLTEQRAARARDEEWGRLVTRVAALVAYANVVSTLDGDSPGLDAADADVLAFLVSAAIYSVG